MTDFIPRDYQIEIINKAITYFQDPTKHKGLLILPCGCGKTLISLWITQKMNSHSILIGVPNKLLLKQWRSIINQMFDIIPILEVSGGISIETITTFLKNSCKCILITTYASSHKVSTVSQSLNYIFDMKILDEAHHLTNNNLTSKTAKSFIQMLNIVSIKQIAITATIKNVEIDVEIEDTQQIISNDNIDYFGEIIDKRSLLWAIEKGIICDYVIQTTIIEDDVGENRELYISALTALKSIADGHSHHLLIYSNNHINSSTIINFINENIQNFKINNLYYSCYNSKMKAIEQKKIINEFEKANVAILSCVYCLGEGWDIPLLDGVVFAENMASNIRIVQSALRASRKDINQPNKITKIILPVLKNDLKKVKKIIAQMGTEDDMITQKVKIAKVNIGDYGKMSHEFKEDIVENLVECFNLLTIKRTIFSTSYDKAKLIISNNNIKNKKQYFELCNIDNRLSKEPEMIYKREFRGWFDYLNINCNYYTINECNQRIREYCSKYHDIKCLYMNLPQMCEKLCEIDSKFPPSDLWSEYYGISLCDIINMKVTKKDKSFILA